MERDKPPLHGHTTGVDSPFSESRVTLTYDRGPVVCLSGSGDRERRETGGASVGGGRGAVMGGGWWVVGVISVDWWVAFSAISLGVTSLR